MTKKNRVPKMVWTDVDLWDQLKAHAREKDTSVSQLIRQLARKELDRNRRRTATSK